MLKRIFRTLTNYEYSFQHEMEKLELEIETLGNLDQFGKKQERKYKDDLAEKIIQANRKLKYENLWNGPAKVSLGGLKACMNIKRIKGGYMATRFMSEPEQELLLASYNGLELMYEHLEDTSHDDEKVSSYVTHVNHRLGIAALQADGSTQERTVMLPFEFYPDITLIDDPGRK